MYYVNDNIIVYCECWESMLYETDLEVKFYYDHESNLGTSWD